jgi:hypothetical protein
VLETAAERGQTVSMICTQPRRISAIGVAERVAAERGEAVGHGAVGYAVRGESRQSNETSLLFCTTGVLLRMLEDDPKLSAVTHVLVDEVQTTLEPRGHYKGGRDLCPSCDPLLEPSSSHGVIGRRALPFYPPVVEPNAIRPTHATVKPS